MSESELRHVQRALGHLRHCCKVGALSPHDRGLVEMAIRGLERVTGGGFDAPLTEEGLLALGAQWSYPTGLYFRLAKPTDGRALSFHATKDKGWEVLYEDGIEGGIVILPTPPSMGGVEALLNSLQMTPPWWEPSPELQKKLDDFREARRRMREEVPEPFDIDASGEKDKP